MTIDELCQVIRQRRKRTGLTWCDGELRENSVAECCPLTAACVEASGVYYDTSKWDVAARHLGINTIIGRQIVRAADGSLGGYDQSIRAKLIAACTGPLD